MNKNEKNIFNPIFFCDFLKQHKYLFIKNLTKDQFKSIFDKLLLENFGELQTKHIILETLLIKERTFEEKIENNKIFLRHIGKTKMYYIPEISEIICKTYYLKYLGGAYGFYNKK
ncbi:hypothetical protein MKD34_00760 [Cetobacterium somerae]|uniref:hypothetical protein n=1 Tax=Cetobacterium somerae TaxID=188913 RepID=UPI001F0696A4|nr:hypothetical protein [Cetobacterium somerae]UPO97398.1 hypothetical protein MKD34_00760 [Cetobacterium somerae]